MIPIVARGIASLAGRMISRNPQLGKNIFSLFNKPKGITLYRGEPARLFGDPSKSEIIKRNLSDIKSDRLRKLAMGRWFSTDLKMAKDFAGTPRFGWLGTPYKPGYIQKVTVSPQEAKLSNKLANRLLDIKGGGLGDYFVVSKNVKKRVKKDQMQTFINNFYKMIGKKKGGLAQILNV
jgi:hypothetical protein